MQPSSSGSASQSPQPTTPKVTMYSLGFANPALLVTRSSRRGETTARRPPTHRFAHVSGPAATHAASKAATKMTAATGAPASDAKNAGPSSETGPNAAPPPTERALLKCVVCGKDLPAAAYPAVDTLPAECPTCGTDLPRRSGYLDLTAERARRRLPFGLPSPFSPTRQAMFQLPNVSFAYERGWRANFAAAGFPGPDAEADLALDALLPAETLLDMSCGSGLLARRLAALTAADADAPAVRVVAADYSDAMLREATARARCDVRAPRIDFVRADVARLPFATAAFDGVHAGAALHCWPRLQDGLCEVRRVLAPGGRFFGTTFAKGAYFPGGVYSLLETAEDLGLYEPPYRFFDEDELFFLFRAAGYDEVRVRREGAACLIVEARNPPVDM